MKRKQSKIYYILLIWKIKNSQGGFINGRKFLVWRWKANLDIVKFNYKKKAIEGLYQAYMVKEALEQVK